MRRSETQPLRDILHEYFRHLRITGKMKEVAAVSHWPEIAGIIVARHTTKIFIRGNKLYVELSSPVVKHQLSMMKEVIIAAFNERAGQKLIDEIILR